MYNNFNPYYNQQQFQRAQQIDQQYVPYQPIPQQTIQNNYRPTSLLGKTVDSMDVVKAIEYPLDGSISYFPLTDGSAIVSKQLQMDGTTKTIIYKPIMDEETVKELPKYITQEDLNEAMNNFIPKDIKDVKEELKSLKKEFRNLKEDIEEKGSE